ANPYRPTGPVRRPKNFSRKHPVTAQPSLAPTAPNTVRRPLIETRARERARNSYIRDHEHPPGGTHMAGYELITTTMAPRWLPRDRWLWQTARTGARGTDQRV